MTDLLRLTADLVDIPSVSYSEQALADHLEGELRAVPWLEVLRHRDNLVARTDLGRPWRLLLAGHIDTVPANGNEQAVVAGDQLHGLGACDMKAGLAIALELARTVERPAVDVSYVFYAGEEVEARHNGLGQLFTEHPDWLVGDAAILGEPTGGAVEAGCQGSLRAGRHPGGAPGPHRPPLDGGERHPPPRGRGRRGRRLRGPAAGARRLRVPGGAPGRPGRGGRGRQRGSRPRHGHGQPPLRPRPDGGRGGGPRAGAPRGVVSEGDRVEVLDVADAAAPGLAHPMLRALVDGNHLDVRAKLGWTDVARFAAEGIPACNFGPGDPTLAHSPDEFVDRADLEAVHAALLGLLTTGAGPT